MECTPEYHLVPGEGSYCGVVRDGTGKWGSWTEGLEFYAVLLRLYPVESRLFFQILNSFKSFFKLFCIGVQLINSGVVVSGEQLRVSAISVHVSILPQTVLPSGLT